MSRGHPPVKAIAEAQHLTSSKGSIVIPVSPDCKLPFDFIRWEQYTVTLVRVRRLRYAGYRIEDIELSCAREIAELRKIPVTDQIQRDLTIRGPDRHWHRYLVLPDSLEVIEDKEETLPDNKKE
jgi:hypothetical protein